MQPAAPQDDTTPPEQRHWLQAITVSPLEFAAFAIVALLLALAGVGGSVVGGLVAPLVGKGSSNAANVVAAILLAGALWVNLSLLRLMPFRVQVGVVWAELLLLFVAFVGSFDRDLGVWFQVGESGQSNIGYLIATGAVTTLYVSLISIAIACMLGMVAALGRLSVSGPAFAASTFYISFFRGTPLLLQVYLIYIGLPQLGPQFALDAVPAGILALSLCYGAYLSENIRAGIIGVPDGQRDAARALGLPRWTAFRKVVLPQAMRTIIPPTGNQFIALLKDSSLVSVMGVWELTRTAQIIGKRDFRVFEMLIAAAIIYWIMSICLELVQARIERHYARGQGRRDHGPTGRSAR